MLSEREAVAVVLTGIIKRIAPPGYDHQYIGANYTVEDLIWDLSVLRLWAEGATLEASPEGDRSSGFGTEDREADRHATKAS